MNTQPIWNMTRDITPSDTVDFTDGPCDGIFVGGAGNVVAIINGTATTFSGIPAGATLSVKATRVNATNTTATLLRWLKQV